MEENMVKICKLLCELLKCTKAGSGIRNITFDDRRCKVLIEYHSGLTESVNVCGDSGIAAIADVIKKLM